MQISNQNSNRIQIDAVSLFTRRMKIFSFRKNGNRQRRSGLRHAKRQLIGGGPNIRTGCWLKLYERYKREKKKAILNTCRTRASKAAAQQQYTRAHKEVRRSIKRDKRSHIKNLAKHAEEAAARGNMRDLYNTTKKLSARYQLTGKQIKDKEGKTLTSVEEQPKRWAEHFSELLNRPERDRDRAAH